MFECLEFGDLEGLSLNAWAKLYQSEQFPNDVYVLSLTIGQNFPKGFQTLYFNSIKS